MSNFWGAVQLLWFLPIDTDRIAVSSVTILQVTICYATRTSDTSAKASSYLVF